MHRFHPFSRKKEATPHLQVEERFTVLCVIDLPENTSEDDLWPVFKEVVPVEDILVAVDFDTRTICDHGFILIERVYQHILLRGSEILLGQRQLIFRESRTRVNEFRFRKMCKEAYRPPVTDWCKDIRPGHPDYQLVEPSSEPFDLEPPEDKPSAHILVDDVIMIIFKRLTVCQLLRIERTCRRWRELVHQILGGHSFVNLADKTSVWGRFGSFDQALEWNYHKYGYRPFFGPTFVHKILVLNSSTLEHLVICNLPVDRRNIQRAIMQCCPNLNHCFDVQLEMFDKSHCYTVHHVAIVHTPLMLFSDWTICQSIAGGKGLKQKCYPSHSQCVCSDYIETIIDEAAAATDSLDA